MNISKTLFKEYSRCPKVYGLDSINKFKLASSIVDNIGEEKVIDLLSNMYNEEGEDILDKSSKEEIEAMLPYYNMFEQYAIETVEKIIKAKITHSALTKEQKMFSFNDGENTYLSYLDGFYDDGNTIKVFEVKSTTSRKFLNLNSGDIHYFHKENNYLKFIGVDAFKGKLNGLNRVKGNILNRYNEIGKYVFDVAFERWVIENYIKQTGTYKNRKIEYYLVILNADYTYDGYKEDNKCVYRTDKEGNELVLLVDVTEETKDYLPLIDSMNNALKDNIRNGYEDTVRVGKYCELTNRKSCHFCNLCFSEVIAAPYSVLEFAGKSSFANKMNKFDLINSGYKSINDVPYDMLNADLHKLQKKIVESGDTYINKKRIIDSLNELEYPLYHLDYESFQNPLPRFKGEHPYCQSVFQFSLHIEKERGLCDKEIDHKEFLVIDQEDHREELIKYLIECIDLSKGGTVIVYNEIFEKTRNKEMGNMFPEYKDDLNNINDHVYDLMKLLQGFKDEGDLKENYYNREQHGSYSIKKILPIFSDLTYKGMPVGNGKEAIIAYTKFNRLEEADLQILRHDLLEYCKQDTWAMVVTLWGIMRLVGINL